MNDDCGCKGISDPEATCWRVAGWIVALLLLIVILAGCTTVEEPCGYMPVAQSQTTVQYVKVYCLGTEV